MVWKTSPAVAVLLAAAAKIAAADGNDGPMIRPDHQPQVAIGFGMNHDSFNAHFAASFYDTASDFAAICDQNSLEHVLLA